MRVEVAKDAREAVTRFAEHLDEEIARLEKQR
jgi:hypothetical protein